MTPGPASPMAADPARGPGRGARLAPVAGAVVGAADGLMASIGSVDPTAVALARTALAIGVGAAIAAVSGAALLRVVRPALRRSDAATGVAVEAVGGAAVAGVVALAPHVGALGGALGAALALGGAALGFGAFVGVRAALRGIELFPDEARWWRIGVGALFVALVGGSAWPYGGGGGEGDDLLLITIGGLRRDHVSAFAPGRGSTPNLDALAAVGTAFDQAVSVRPDAAAAAASIVTGAHPLRHGLLGDGDRLDRGWTTVASALAARGFATGAFLSDPGLRGRGLERGFGRFDANDPPRIAAIGAVRLAWGAFVGGREDATTAAAFAAWWAAQPGPRFAWVGLDVGPAATDGYAAAVARVDAAIGAALAGVDRAHTRIVVASTSGRMLGEHGLSGGEGLYDELVRVPVIVAVPGGSGGRVDRQVRLSDVGPTLLAFGGAPAGGSGDGVSLFAEARSGPAAVLVGEAAGAWVLGLRTPTLKVVRPASGGLEQAYRLVDDPWEAEDIAASHLDAQGRPDAALAEVRARLADEATRLSAHPGPR